MRKEILISGHHKRSHIDWAIHKQRHPNIQLFKLNQSFILNQKGLALFCCLNCNSCLSSQFYSSSWDWIAFSVLFRYPVVQRFLPRVLPSLLFSESAGSDELVFLGILAPLTNKAERTKSNKICKEIIHLVNKDEWNMYVRVVTDVKFYSEAGEF